MSNLTTAWHVMFLWYTFILQLNCTRYIIVSYHHCRQHHHFKFDPPSPQTTILHYFLPVFVLGMREVLDETNFTSEI